MSDTSQVTGTIDVLAKYSSLVKESLGGDSIYIRAKETVLELVAEGALDDTKKSEVISGIIGSAVSSITSSAMSAALDWAKYEKELALKKLELDQQLLILDQERLLKTAQVAQIKDQNRIALIESRRMFGTAIFVDDALTTLSEDGKVWTDMELVKQNTINSGKEELLIESKLKESQVAIHKVVADTYINYGSFTFALSADGNGVDTVNRNDGSVTLSDTQQEIAVEQGKGYTYNAWANALTGSASMLGTAIASGDFDFGPGTPGQLLLYSVLNCAENLKTADSTTSEAIPSSSIVP